MLQINVIIEEISNALRTGNWPAAQKLASQLRLKMSNLDATDVATTRNRLRHELMSLLAEQQDTDIEEAALTAFHKTAEIALVRLPDDILATLAALSIWNGHFVLVRRWTDPALQTLRDHKDNVDDGTKMILLQRARMEKVHGRDREAESILSRCLLQGQGAADRSMLMILFEMVEFYVRNLRFVEARSACKQAANILFRAQTISPESLSETHFWTQYFELLVPVPPVLNRPRWHLSDEYSNAVENAIAFYDSIGRCLTLADVPAEKILKAGAELKTAVACMESRAVESFGRMKIQLELFLRQQRDNQLRLDQRLFDVRSGFSQ